MPTRIGAFTAFGPTARDGAIQYLLVPCSRIPCFPRNFVELIAPQQRLNRLLKPFNPSPLTDRQRDEVPMSSRFDSLLGFLSKYRRRYVIGIFSVIATNLFVQVLPWAAGRFFTDLKEERLTTTEVWQTIGLISAAALLLAIFRFAWRIYVFGTARYVETDLREELFAHLQRLSPSFYHRNKTGDLMGPGQPMTCRPCAASPVRASS
jgi:hypothetical protein